MDVQIYTFLTGQHPASITKSLNHVFVANKVDGSVSKFDLSGNLISTTGVDTLPVTIKFYNDLIYVASQGTMLIREYDLAMSPTGNSWSCIDAPIKFDIIDDHFIILTALNIYVKDYADIAHTYPIAQGKDVMDNSGPKILTADGNIYSINLTTYASTLLGSWNLTNAISFIYHAPTTAYYVAEYSAHTVYKLGVAPAKTDMVTGHTSKIFFNAPYAYLISDSDSNIRKATIDGIGMTAVSIVHTGDTPVDALVDQNTDIWVADLNANCLNKIMYWTGDESNPIIPTDELIELIYNTPDKPVAMATDGGNYWLVCQQAEKLIKLSPIGTVLRETATEVSPRSVIYLAGKIYVANSGSGTISTYNRDGSFLASYAVTPNPWKFATDGVSLYLVDKIAMKLKKFDQNLNLITNVDLAYIPDNIEFLNGVVYVSSNLETKFYRYSAALALIGDSAIVYAGTKYFTTDGISLFVVSNIGNTLFKCQFDGTVLQQRATYVTPTGITYDSGYLWVITYTDSLLTRYDQALTIYDHYNIGYHPVFIFTDHQYVWVTTEQNQAVKVLSNVAQAHILPRNAFINYELETHITDLKFDNGLFYIPAYFSDKVYVVNMNGTVVQELATGNKPYKVSTNNFYLAVYCAGDNHFYIYNKSDYSAVGNFVVGSQIASVACDGIYFWASSVGDSKIYKFDTAGVVAFSDNVPLSPAKVRFNGQKVYVAINTMHEVISYDPTTHDRIDYAIPGIEVVDTTVTDNLVALCRSSDEFIKVNTVGTPIFAAKTNRAPGSILFDGKYTWVIEGINNTISRYLNDTKIDSYYLPQYPYEFAFDGTDLWAISLYGGQLTRIIVKYLDNYSGLSFVEAPNYPDSFIGTAENMNKPINGLKANTQYLNEELSRVKGELKESAGNFPALHERLDQIMDADGNFVKGTVYTTDFHSVADLQINVSGAKDIIFDGEFYWILQESRLTKISKDVREYYHFTYDPTYRFQKFVLIDDIFYVLEDTHLFRINTDGRIVTQAVIAATASDFCFDSNSHIIVSKPAATTVTVYDMESLVIVSNNVIATGLQSLFFCLEEDRIYATSVSNRIFKILPNFTIETQYVGGVNPVDCIVTEGKIFTLNHDDSSIVMIDEVSHLILKAHTTLTHPTRFDLSENLFFIYSDENQPTEGAVEVLTTDLFQVEIYSLEHYNFAKYADENVYALNDNYVAVHNVAHNYLQQMIGGEYISIAQKGGKAVINNDLDPEDFKVFARGDKFEIAGITTPSDILFDGLYAWVSSADDMVVKKYNTFGTFISNTILPQKPRGLAEDGMYIYVSCDDRRIYKIDRANGAIATSWATGMGPNELMWFNDELYVTCSGEATIYKYDHDGNALGSIGLTGWAHSIANDEHNIYTAQQDNMLSKYTPAGALIWTVATNNNPQAVRFDGTSMWVAEFGHNTITRYALDGTVIGEYPVGGNPKDIVFVDEYVCVLLYDQVKIAKYDTLGNFVEDFLVNALPQAADDDGPYAWVACSNGTVVRIQLTDAQIQYVQSGNGIRFDVRGTTLTISLV